MSRNDQQPTCRNVKIRDWQSNIVFWSSPNKGTEEKIYIQGEIRILIERDCEVEKVIN